MLAAGLLVAQSGDARRGAEIFQKRNCTLCHSIHGTGGGTAPDLARPGARDFTPAVLAAVMWNHAPAMWAQMRARNLEVPPLSSGEIADLYAYFYSERYFDPPGDAARGKNVFMTRRCSSCHGPEPGVGPSVGPPISKWPSTTDPVRWAQEMWNHSGAMARAMEQARISWPTLTVQEMVDLQVYVNNLPGRALDPPRLVFGEPAIGEKLFDQHGCARCHSVGAREAGRIDLLASRDAPNTLAGFAVSMWNHGPRMRRRQIETSADILPFRDDEMKHLLSYLLAKHYFEEKGNPSRGRRVAEAKKCGVCHDLKGKEGEFTAARLAGALWQHGPKMQAEMEKRGIRWPTFTGREMADLVAWLNAR